MTTPFNESDILIVFEIARIALMNNGTIIPKGESND